MPFHRPPADGGANLTMRYLGIFVDGRNVMSDQNQPAQPYVENDQQRQARTALSSLQQADAAAAAVQKTPHRVTLADLHKKIRHEQYIYPIALSHLTICVVVLDNGFAVVGTSAPADPANFNEALGKKFAMEDCLRQLWKLEGYNLRVKLHEAVD